MAPCEACARHDSTKFVQVFSGLFARFSAATLRLRCVVFLADGGKLAQLALGRYGGRVDCLPGAVRAVGAGQVRLAGACGLEACAR
jgi:hypothetical protein